MSITYANIIYHKKNVYYFFGTLCIFISYNYMSVYIMHYN